MFLMEIVTGILESEMDSHRNHLDLKSFDIQLNHLNPEVIGLKSIDNQLT